MSASGRTLFQILFKQTWRQFIAFDVNEVSLFKPRCELLGVFAIKAIGSLSAVFLGPSQKLIHDDYEAFFPKEHLARHDRMELLERFVPIFKQANPTPFDRDVPTLFLLPEPRLGGAGHRKTPGLLTTFSDRHTRSVAQKINF